MITAEPLLFAQAPFDRLTDAERRYLLSAAQVAHFPAGAELIGPGTDATHLFVIDTGQVEERVGSELIRRYGPGHRFDLRGLVHGPNDRRYGTTDETACLCVPRLVLLDLIRANAGFAALIYREVARMLDPVASRAEAGQVNALMTARIADAYLQPAVFIDGDETILTAGRRMRDNQTNALLVRDRPDHPHPFGIITGMNLSKAVVLNGKPLDTPVRTVTHAPLVTIRPDAFIATALQLMTKHVKRRLVVTDGDSYLGILHEIDLLAFFSTNSHVIAGRIELATDLKMLEPISTQIMDAVQTWHAQGLKVTILNDLVSELNRKLFQKAYGFLAPTDFRDDACLIVMGSEGRGEQTLPTDQDNGLILRTPVPESALEPFRHAFAHVLERFGYPPCPGDVMVRNPMWSKPLSAFQTEIRRWITLPDEDSVLRVAILVDAAAVAGDHGLLDQLKATVFDCLAGNDAFLSQFARSVDTFASPLGWFQTLVTEDGDQRDALDLKKAGLFPIVHGVRTLALQHRLPETGTVPRIAALRRIQVLDAAFAQDLTEAYEFLLDLQLQSKLTKRDGGTVMDALVRPRLLSAWHRAMLKRAFQITLRFRDLIRHRFRLVMY